MIDGSVLQSSQKCFEKKSRVVMKMVVNKVFRLDTSFSVFKLREIHVFEGNRVCENPTIMIVIARLPLSECHRILQLHI